MRIEPARLTHVNPLALNMREADRIECAALGRTPKDALRIGLRTGLHTMTAIGDDGRPAAMFGLFVVSTIGGTATPWFLGTEQVFAYPRELLVIGRRVIAWWLGEFPHLSNIVAVQNRAAIKLLMHWGAIVGGNQQMHRGVAFVPFYFGGDSRALAAPVEAELCASL